VTPALQAHKIRPQQRGCGCSFELQCAPSSVERKGHDHLRQKSGSRNGRVALLYRVQMYLVMSQCKNWIPLSVTCSSGSPKVVRTPLSSKLLKRGHIVSCSLCIKEKSTPGNCCFVSCKLRLASHFDQPASRKPSQLSGLAGPYVCS